MSSAPDVVAPASGGAPRIEFWEAGHVYHVDGRRTWSVTEVLDDNRLRNPYTGVPRRNIERAGRRGASVHDDIYAVESGGDPRREFLHIDRYLEWRAGVRWQSLACEQLVSSVSYRYAGRVDQLGRLSGCHLFLEVKTRKIHWSDGLQVVAYKWAYIERYEVQWGPPVPQELLMARCAVLELSDDRPARLHLVGAPSGPGASLRIPLDETLSIEYFRSAAVLSNLRCDMNGGRKEVS